MKKLFSFVTLLVLVVGLTGCTQDLDTKITDLEAEIDALEAQITTLEGEKSHLEDQFSAAELLIQEKRDAITELNGDVEELEGQVADLLAQMYEKVITLTLVDEEGTISKPVGVPKDFEGTVFDLLDATYDVDATESEFGHYITRIEDLSPVNGQFISISQNGVASMVGIDSMTFEDKDDISFEVVWWDMTEKAVSEGIEAFLDNQAADYVNATSINYHVASALAHLGLLEDYVTDAEVEAYVAGLTLSTTGDYFKAITILEAAGLDATDEYTALNAIAAPAGYGGTGYQLTAFSANAATVDFSTFETAALADIATTTPAALGIDSGAITVIALSEYQTETGVDTLIADWVALVKTQQAETGGLVDLDFGWGASENAATTAQAVLGLLALGENPDGEDYTVTDTQITIITRLLEFQNADGSFDYLFDAETADLGFSTPQGFLALASYYTYSNTGEAVNPYSFE